MNQEKCIKINNWGEKRKIRGYAGLNGVSNISFCLWNRHTKSEQLSKPYALQKYCDLVKILVTISVDPH